MKTLIDFIDDYGGSALAKKLGVSKATVSGWRNGRFGISPRRCLEIERLSGGKVLASVLLPEIFGEGARFTDEPRDAA